jgi:hypothetical protein
MVHDGQTLSSSGPIDNPSEGPNTAVIKDAATGCASVCDLLMALVGPLVG